MSGPYTISDVEIITVLAISESLDYPTTPLPLYWWITFSTSCYYCNKLLVLVPEMYKHNCERPRNYDNYVELFIFLPELVVGYFCKNLGSDNCVHTSFHAPIRYSTRLSRTPEVCPGRGGDSFLELL